MDKKQTAVILIVFMAVVGAAVFFTYKGVTPTIPEEFSPIDDELKELDDFLNFENQVFDFDLGEIAGDWE
ncbi:MAG: hypothetical protein ACE5OT_00705 [Candidatus Hadarchaeaceae archaeon]